MTGAIPSPSVNHVEVGPFDFHFYGAIFAIAIAVGVWIVLRRWEEVGGDPKVVEEVRPVLDCMGTDYFYCGELGMGEAMKLANNFLANTILSATSEALVMGVKAGLTLDTMMSVMRTTMAWNNQLGVSLPKKALADDFSLGFMVRLAEKDHRLAVEMAKSLGVDTPVGSAAFDVLQQASSNGLAGLDVSAVLRLREEQAGVKVRLSR